MSNLLREIENLLVIANMENCGINPALYFSKYFEAGQVEKLRDLNQICSYHNFNISKASKKYNAMESYVKSLPENKYRCLSAVTTANLAINLSQGAIVENACISMNYPDGFVYLPGSSVKGICRSYAESNGIDANTIREIFGDDSEDGSKHSSSIIFYDAFSSNAKLHVDISNCHHMKYYDEKKNIPLDDEQPNPVFFLALKPGAKFNFYLVLKDGGNSENLNMVFEILQKALSYNGIGAKTSLGYGSFNTGVPLEQNDNVINTILTLDSPAFLAGADPSDSTTCTLRPSTLKGMLRWWWRKLYIGNSEKTKELAKKLGLSEKSVLQAVERVVWGGIKNNEIYRSPIQINIKNITLAQKPFISLKKYTTFGMFKMGDKGIDRKVVAAGTSWQVSFKCPNAIIKQELEKALFLLSSYGGIGAKSRKGFGSVSFNIKFPEVKELPFSVVTLVSDDNLKSALNDSNNFLQQLSCLFIKMPIDHDNRCKKDEQLQFGYAKSSDRYASPVIISIHKKNDKYLVQAALFAGNGEKLEQRTVETIKKFLNLSDINQIPALVKFARPKLSEKFQNELAKRLTALIQLEGKFGKRNRKESFKDFNVLG